MPEAAEVARQAEWLQQFQNREIVEIHYDERSKFNRKDIENLDQFPKKIIQVFSRGKIIVLVLEGNFFIVNHLGMTGYWSIERTKHANLWIQLRDGQNIYFTDQRHFGNFNITDSLEKTFEKNGPCILTSALKRYGKIQPNIYQKIITRLEWHKAFQMNSRQQKVKICDFLLEQKRFSGIGNYLRSEIMYYSKVHPEQTVASLTRCQIDTLYEKSMEIVYLSYKYNGPANGYLSGGCLPLAVYGKEKDPRGNPIVRYVSKNRTVHYCPKIQQFNS